MTVNASWHADYPLHAKIGTVLSLAVLLLASQFPTGERAVDTGDEPPRDETIDLKDVAPTRHAETAPPPPAPVPPVEVPNDQIVDAEPVDFDEDIPVDVESEATTAPPPPEKERERTEPFVAVEQMPQLVGGMKALYDKVTYPPFARRAGIEGSVVLRFVVTADGEVRDIEVVESVHPRLDAEAKEALKNVRFRPGQQRGRRVPVRMTIPIRFRLK